ncbi:MAG: helix-turn-helix domain-containing protein [Candidatus Pacearchaeota archaeon]|nr:helix-turn-helix domain-containing protein [Candidatus Pacearchaeota archaeon]
MIKEIPGLTSNESLVYITLLNLKGAGATKISEKCGLFRTLCYDILTKLAEKGLVSHINQKGKRMYKPSNPERLIEILKEKQNETERVLPELNHLFSVPEEEISVQQFEGASGMKAIVEDMIADALRGKIKECFWLGPRGTSIEFMGAYLKDMIKRSKKIIKNIDLRLIWSSDIHTEDFIKVFGEEKNHRFLPKGFASTVPFIVYGDKLVITGGINKPFTILIKNRETADSFKIYFNFIWKFASKKL